MTMKAFRRSGISHLNALRSIHFQLQHTCVGLVSTSGQELQIGNIVHLHSIKYDNKSTAIQMFNHHKNLYWAKYICTVKARLPHRDRHFGAAGSI